MIIGYGAAGYTHHTVEDPTVMRVLLNMMEVICCLLISK